MIKKQTKKIVEKTQTGLSRGLGIPILAEGGRFIGDTIRKLFNIPRLEQKETFEQAMSRLKLSEADLDKQMKRYWQQFWVFVGFGLAVLIYTVSLFLQSSVGAGLVSLMASILFFVYALRAHFWIFQIKNRKLGCSLKEWWSNKIDESK